MSVISNRLLLFLFPILTFVSPFQAAVASSPEEIMKMIKIADRFGEAGWTGAHVIRFFERLGNSPGLFGSKGPKQAYGAQNYILL